MDSAAEPGFSDERLGGKIAALITAVADLEIERDHPHLAADVLAMQQQLERAHRRLGAARIDNLARIEAERLHRIDGHRSVKAHARHVLKISPEETSRQAKAARALRDLPEVASALQAGRLGLDHAQIIGGFKDNKRNHDNRNVRLIHNSIEGVWELSGHFAADQGTSMREIFDHFVDAEWRVDWADAREKLGDAATISDLKRTDAQRRADAFVRMCNDAAALDTHWSATLTDPAAQRGLWCSARHAAQLQSPHCIRPGCDHPTTRCEVDHLHEYNNGGPTNPANGAPLCGFHNRWKQKGFSVTRDPVSGGWRTYRPDGSVIE